MDVAVDDQRATIDGGRAGIGVDAGERKGASALLGQRTDGAAVDTTVLDDARESGRPIVAANLKLKAAEGDGAAAFDRTELYPRRREIGEIENTGVVELDASFAAV